MVVNRTLHETISAFLRERIDAGDFPSAVYLVAERGDIVFQDALGNAVVQPDCIGARIDTIYDLASLTKPLVCGLLTAKLIENGELSLSQDVSAYLPAWKPISRQRPLPPVTLRQLTTHTTGFSAWKPFYLVAESRETILTEIIAATLPLAQLPPTVIYSDLNFLVLTFLVEKIAGSPIDAVAEREIFGPLGIEDAFFNPDLSLRPRIAASEKGNRYERETCIELGYIDRSSGEIKTRDGRPAFRTEMIWGDVHDGNAYFMHGFSGHAGLFGTADAVFELCKQFLSSSTKLLKPETCSLFHTNFTPGLNEDRSLGFQLASTADSTAGTQLSQTSFGHTGFTGTSAWIDPASDRIFVLLTNRTHAKTLPFANINAVRRQFHDLAAAALDKISN